MGLDAVVYRDKAHLELGADEEAAIVAPETGEVYFESDALARKYSEQGRAVARRISNIAAISELREEVSRLIGSSSFTITKILYSGSHCGDTIALESLPALSAELAQLRGTAKQSAELHQFVDSFEELVRAAKAERNPIVFV
jgi:hypothetical protein